MRRVSVVFFGLLCVVFVLTQAAIAEEKPVTSDKLSIGDIKPYLEKLCTSRNQKVQHIFGIHQEGTQATIFFTVEGQLMAGAPGAGAPGAGKKGSFNISLKLLRFNSGEWFDATNYSLVTK